MPKKALLSRIFSDTSPKFSSGMVSSETLKKIMLGLPLWKMKAKSLITVLVALLGSVKLSAADGEELL